MSLNGDSNLGGQWIGGKGESICTTVGDVAVLHRNDLGDNPEEADLEGSSQAAEDFSADESVDVLSCGTENATNETKDGTDDEEPTTTKDVAQSPNNKEKDCLGQEVDPCEQ